eukprot:TRINITY_DN4831_c0_g1_i1.p1 TRINITY_DN4831_c0_g1~~TRINITY_DN4831_c0_g1_i1.p1  ORF type:complete len:446 (+),score=98.23 TRINITY_DN4831_c0_g1_i1:105-1442(+)
MSSYEGHRCCFEGDLDGLKKWIKQCKTPEDIDSIDPQGNTPLLVATMLNRLDCVQLLLAAGANVEAKTKLAWPVSAEAISIADHQLVKALFQHEAKLGREKMKAKTRPLLQHLKEKKDFYMEISWDLHSWVPLVSRALPSDTLKIWKRGCSVRLDTSLMAMGPDQGGVKQGDQSIICVGNLKKDEVVLYNMNHDERVYTRDVLFASTHEARNLDEDVQQALLADLVDLVLETESAEFHQALQGIYGFRTERVDQIGDHECQVYNCNNVSAVTRVRREHLTPEMRQWSKGLKTKLQAGQLADEDLQIPAFEPVPLYERPKITFEQYLRAEEYVHLGRPMMLKERKKPHKAAVWMAKDFKLSIDSLLDILTVLAPASSAVAALKRFVEQRLPQGFPIKLDIPVFPTVSARVCFDRYEEDAVDARLFEIPRDYVQVTRDAQSDVVATA